MKKKYFIMIIILLVILATCILASQPSPINRQKSQMTHATFEVPDGYRITDTGNHSVTIKDTDKNHVITVYEPVNATDLETAITLYEDKTSDNTNVTKETYIFNRTENNDLFQSLPSILSTNTTHTNITGMKTTTQKLDKDNKIITTTRYWFTYNGQVFYAQTRNTASHVEKDIIYIVNSLE